MCCGILDLKKKKQQMRFALNRCISVDKPEDRYDKLLLGESSYCFLDWAEGQSFILI